MQLRQIPPASIITEGSPLRYRPASATGPFRDSIHRNGILAPPGVAPDGSGGFRLLFGFRRVDAARALGLPVIPVIVFDPEPVGKGLAGLIAADNAGFARNLADTAGLAGVLQNVSGFTARECDTAFGAVADGRSFAELAEIASLPGRVLDAVRSGRLDEDKLSLLARTDPAVLLVLVRLLLDTGAACSRGDLRQAAALFRELAVHCGGNPAAVLTEAEWETAREARLTPKQRTERILALLHARRYPLLRECRRRFDSARDRVTGPLSGSIDIRNHPCFEHPGLQISLNVKDGAALAQAVGRLHSALEAGTAAELFRAAAGELPGEPADED